MFNDSSIILLLTYLWLIKYDYENAVSSSRLLCVACNKNVVTCMKNIEHANVVVLCPCYLPTGPCYRCVYLCVLNAERFTSSQEPAEGARLASCEEPGPERPGAGAEGEERVPAHERERSAAGARGRDQTPK